MEEAIANTRLMNECLMFHDEKCHWCCFFKLCVCDRGYRKLVDLIDDQCVNASWWLGPEHDDGHRMIHGSCHLRADSWESFEIDLRCCGCQYEKMHCEIGFCNVNYISPKIDLNIRLARISWYGTLRQEFIKKFKHAIFKASEDDLKVVFTKLDDHGKEFVEIRGAICRCGECFKDSLI